MSKYKIAATILPLFLILFIDGMGLSLLFPVLNSIIIDVHSHFLPLTVSLASRDFLYGLVVGIFMLCWFFGAAILGDLSDMAGRKKSLLICLIGAFLGYLLSAFAVKMDSLLFLIIGRVIAGFTAGSQPIAQAAIIDVSPPEMRARNIAWILLASCLGFVIGPIIGGFLSDSHIVSWFGFSTPLYFAALISLINAILLKMSFNETHLIKQKIKIQFHHSVNIFISAFKHPKIRKLSLMFFVMMYGWSNFYSFIPLFVLNRYHYDPLKISFLLAVMGLGFSIGCGYLVGFFVKRFPLKPIIITTLLFTALGMFLTVIIYSSVYLWWWMAWVGATLSVAYSAIITLFSEQVGENEQGWVMGVTGAIMALCFGLSSFLTGYLAGYNPEFPMYLAVIGIGLSALLMFFIPKKLN